MWRWLTDLVRKRRHFWSSVPARGHALVLGAVFFLFSGVGLLSDIISLGVYPLSIVFVFAAVSGAIAVFFTLTFIRNARYLLVAVALYMVLVWLASGLASSDPVASSQRQARIKTEATAVIVAVTTAHGLFIVFIAGEGRRYLRAHTEVALAQEIHRHLVPTIDRTIGCFEFFGASLPSSEVGGDLVDVGGRWMAYVADVSGHGVASGALMGMFKSAVRTRVSVDVSLDALLSEVNRVVCGLRKPGMFVTCALVSGPSHAPGTLRFATAGHPAILHKRAASDGVERLTTAQPPIAMLDEATAFRSADVDVGGGDVLALVSDGLMEVFNRQDVEYGLDRLEQSLAANAARPLRDVFDALVAGVRRHGPQLDDQSLLLVRVLR